MNKIMLIDDDPSLQLALRSIICDEGYEFCCASDGRSGLDMLSSEHPDLLLLDVMLPKMNGYDVCREMRAQGRRIPVLFLPRKATSWTRGSDSKRAATTTWSNPSTTKSCSCASKRI